MDDAPALPTTDMDFSFPPQKLKNTCDMCAASKVMCDKMKPICGRCERLRYPCFFSPARRVRKRRRCIRSSSENKSEAAEQSPKPRPFAMDMDESATSNFKALDDSGGFDYGDEMNGVNGFDWFSSKIFGSDTSLPLLNTDNHDKSDSSAMEPISSGSGYGQNSSSIASESDCATIAMNILQHLNTTYIKQASTPTHFDETQPPTIDDLINTASINIKRVSTILICPCSENTDVGLLVAAVCAAILDIYELVLYNSIKSKVVSSSTEQHGTVEKFSINSAVGEVEGMDIGPEALQDEPKDEKAAIMRMLKELPKVANLITQFTKRYGQGAEECARDLPQALAALITCRLKSVIDEVTNWVARI